MQQIVCILYLSVYFFRLIHAGAFNEESLQNQPVSYVAMETMDMLPCYWNAVLLLAERPAKAGRWCCRLIDRSSKNLAQSLWATKNPTIH